MADLIQPPPGFTRANLYEVYKEDCNKAERILPYPVSFRVDKSNVDKTIPEKPRVIPRLIAVYPDETFQNNTQSKPAITGTVAGSISPTPPGDYPIGGPRFIIDDSLPEEAYLPF